MTHGGEEGPEEAPDLPAAGLEEPAPVRARTSFVGHEVFGHGPGAALVAPGVARDLRTAAEFASQERRIGGGLLYGRLWADDEGGYLVVEGFLESGPGEDFGDKVHRDGRDSFDLSPAGLRLLRTEAARVYPSLAEVGWWRSLSGGGEFGPRDFESQRALVGPGGVGLLVFGSGLKWGTAYLGADGTLPGSARSFIPVPRPAAPPVPPALGPAEDPELAPGDASVTENAVMDETSNEAGTDAVTAKSDLIPGLVPVDADSAPEAEPAVEREPVGVGAGTAAPARPLRSPEFATGPKRIGPRTFSPIPLPSREWGRPRRRKPEPDPEPVSELNFEVEPSIPNDVKIVIALLVLDVVIAAIMIGALMSNYIVAIIAGVVLLLGLTGLLWASRVSA